MGHSYVSKLNREYKTYSFKGVNGKKTLIPYTCNILPHLLSFSWQIIYLKNVNVYTIWGGGSEKVNVLYTELNGDN